MSYREPANIFTLLRLRARYASRQFLPLFFSCRFSLRAAVDCWRLVRYFDADFVIIRRACLFVCCRARRLIIAATYGAADADV